MKRKASDRDIMRALYLRLLPLPVRESLFSDRAFLARNDIRGMDATLSVDNGEFAFSRNSFLRSLRLAYRTVGMSVPVKDQNGNVWQLIAKHNGDIRVVGEAVSLNLRDYEFLKPRAEQRLAALKKKAQALHVDLGEFQHWQPMLRKSISNEMYYAILEDLEATPLAFAYSLGKRLQTGQSLEFDDLVPRNPAYYRRLTGLPLNHAGKNDGSEDYIVEHINGLLASNTVQALKLGLVLSCDSIASSIDAALLEKDTVVETFQNLVERGDRVSQLGAIELGFRLVHQWPEIESPMVSMIDQMCSDTAADASGCFYQLYNLLLLVRGELAHGGISKSTHPSWIRSASMSHAALLQGVIMEFGANLNREPFYDGVLQHRGLWYLVASLVDLRQDPNWQPEYAYHTYLRNGFLTRIWLFGQHSMETLSEASDLMQLFTEGHPRCIAQFIHPPFVVGPIEGTLKTSAISDDVLQTIYRELAKETLSVSDFAQIVRLATCCNVNDDTVARISEALTRLREPVDANNSVIVKGLAMIAASSRNETLADQVRQLCGTNRFPNSILNIEAVLEVVLIAAASRSEVESWCLFAASWLTEVAFQELDKRSSQVLSAYIIVLIQIAPELKPLLQRALAAVECVE